MGCSVLVRESGATGAIGPHCCTDLIPNYQGPDCMKDSNMHDLHAASADAAGRGPVSGSSHLLVVLDLFDLEVVKIEELALQSLVNAIKNVSNGKNIRTYARRCVVERRERWIHALEGLVSLSWCSAQVQHGICGD